MRTVLIAMGVTLAGCASGRLATGATPSGECPQAPPVQGSSMGKQPITELQRSVIRWLLDNARTPDGEDYSGDIGNLCVLEEWDTNSFDFEPGGLGKYIIADATARWPDGAVAGVLLWAKDGRIQGLEVYDGTPGASDRFPTPDILSRGWGGNLDR